MFVALNKKYTLARDTSPEAPENKPGVANRRSRINFFPSNHTPRQEIIQLATINVNKIKTQFKRSRSFMTLLTDKQLDDFTHQIKVDIQAASVLPRTQSILDAVKKITKKHLEKQYDDFAKHIVFKRCWPAIEDHIKSVESSPVVIRSADCDKNFQLQSENIADLHEIIESILNNITPEVQNRTGLVPLCNSLLSALTKITSNSPQESLRTVHSLSNRLLQLKEKPHYFLLNATQEIKGLLMPLNELDGTELALRENVKPLATELRKTFLSSNPYI